MLNPYLGVDGTTYWLTITESIKNGIITADMTLSFLSEMVKETAQIPGSLAIILTADTTILASSSPEYKLGEKMSSDSNTIFSALAQKVVKQDQIITSFESEGIQRQFFSKRINVGDKQWYFTFSLDKSVAFAKLEHSAKIAIITAVIAVIISMILAFLIIQILYRPIISLKKMLLELSSGEADLTQRLEVNTQDDLGQMAQSINRFIENLQNMMREIQGATATLETRVNEMQDRSSHNASILQSHVVETEQVVTAIEEMNSTADAMATDAANTAELTHQANQAGNESKRIVQKSQGIVSELMSDVDSAVTNVGNMSDKTQGINNILEVISGIAEQTNLLALNAAIEAARAGEQGRGFAVVADEVRNLASRTKDSTEEVATALESLLKGTDMVVESMDHTKARCQETGDSTGEMAGSLDAMSNYVDEINGLSSQIATAAEEQSSVTQELTRNMSAINDMVQELESNGEQVLQGTTDITSVNEQLGAIVSRFKL